MEIEKSFVEQLMKCNWLSKCGVEEDLGFEVEYIKSRAKAEKMIKSLKWENVCLEASGDFSSFLHKNHKADFNKYWNQVVHSVKQEYMNDITYAIESALDDFTAKESVLNDMKFHIITLFLNNFYSENYSSEFYNKMLKIYLSGHLPCGFSGNYPDGRFIVY